jgi:hypothetical protein
LRCRNEAIEVIRTPPRQAHLEQLQITHHPREQVVEIVSQATRELAYRLHLLALP